MYCMLIIQMGITSGQNYEGCTTTDTASITQLSAIQSTGVITNVDCYGNATGKDYCRNQTTGGISFL